MSNIMFETLWRIADLFSVRLHWVFSTAQSKRHSSDSSPASHFVALDKHQTTSNISCRTTYNLSTWLLYKFELVGQVNQTLM